MATNNLSNEYLNRDGLSQVKRQSPLLEPGYISVDERSISDWISFIQHFAAKVIYYDDEDEKAGYWTDFIPQITDLEDESQYSAPHRALFYTFLKLLNHHKTQMNAFSERHLQFTYTQLFGFQQRGPVPDYLHTVFQLAPNQDALYLEAGTSLLAGQDSEGNNLIYTTDNRTLLNQAQVTQLKSTYFDNVVSTIRTVRENAPGNSADGGFMDLLRLALGAPDPGDLLPLLNGGEPNEQDLRDVLATWDQTGSDAPYVEEQLYLSESELEIILELQADWRNQPASRWTPVYEILENAYQRKVYARNRAEIKSIREAEQDQFEGFQAALLHALGDPNPGNELPLYPGGNQTLDDVLDDLDPNGNQISRAVSYMEDELHLRQPDFEFLMEVRDLAGGTLPVSNEDWETLYTVLELASRLKRTEEVPLPEKIEVEYLYAYPDATRISAEPANDGDNSNWRPFGAIRTDFTEPGVGPQTFLGFAIASPLLVLEEGSRVVELTLSFEPEGYDLEFLDLILNPPGGATTEISLFDFSLSAGATWLIPTVDYAQPGTFINGSPEKVLAGSVVVQPNNDIHFLNSNTNSPVFSADDLEGFLVMSDEKVYRVLELISLSEIKVEEVSQLTESSEAPTTASLYYPDTIAVQGLRFRLALGDDADPVLAPSTPELTLAWPVLRLQLSPQEEDGFYRNEYQNIRNLTLQTACLQTIVTGLKELQIRNELGDIDPRKTFTPFGQEPVLGDSFYLVHPELCAKRLDQLTLEVEWKGLPQPNFEDYYASYVEVDQSEGTGTGYNFQTTNSSFQLAVELVERRSPKRLTGSGNTGIPLFSTTVNNSVTYLDPEVVLDIPDLPDALAQTVPAYQYVPLPELETAEDPLDWERHFQLELVGQDFLHPLYPELLTKRALLLSEAVVLGNNTNVTHWTQQELPAPYTPQIASIEASYRASQRFSPLDSTHTAQEGILHILPFGYQFVAETDTTSFLPQINNLGELFIGLSDLTPPTQLSLLLQTAEGSANPDEQKTQVTWSILTGNTWQELAGGDILSDETSGMIETGIITLQLPENASTTHTQLPSGVHWLRASAPKALSAFPDLLAVSTQAIRATLQSTGHPTVHYERPLVAESITQLQTADSAIAQVSQPFPSIKGKTAEIGEGFYTRVSERIRHKQRALTNWDYERLTLEAFPEIYKVICLPCRAATEKGEVTIVVIPDIRGDNAFASTEPKASTAKLEEIHDYLTQYCPPWVTLTVRNPEYVQVKTRMGIRFRRGFDPNFTQDEIQEALRRYLAPWTFDEGADIILGGKIYANSIVDFLEHQASVDFVTQIKLFQREGNDLFRDVRVLTGGENAAIALEPYQVLSTAGTHEIDLITDEIDLGDDRQGINYMRVGLDFLIGLPNL